MPQRGRGRAEAIVDAKLVDQLLRQFKPRERVDFNAWPLTKRMEHAERCTREEPLLGVFDDERGRFTHPDGQPEAMRRAEAIAQLVARRMDGQRVDLPSDHQPTHSLPSKASEPRAITNPCHVWVSSDLRCIVGQAGDCLGRDVQQQDDDRQRVYRRLDLGWYGYLHLRMTKAEAMANAGEISASAWDITRARFRAVWSHARKAWSETDLAAAAHWSSDTYQPPINPGSTPLPALAGSR